MNSLNDLEPPSSLRFHCKPCNRHFQGRLAFAYHNRKNHSDGDEQADKLGQNSLLNLTNGYDIREATAQIFPEREQNGNTWDDSNPELIQSPVVGSSISPSSLRHSDASALATRDVAATQADFRDSSKDIVLEDAIIGNLADVIKVEMEFENDTEPLLELEWESENVTQVDFFSPASVEIGRGPDHGLSSVEFPSPTWSTGSHQRQVVEQHTEKSAIPAAEGKDVTRPGLDTSKLYDGFAMMEQKDDRTGSTNHIMGTWTNACIQQGRGHIGTPSQTPAMEAPVPVTVQEPDEPERVSFELIRASKAEPEDIEMQDLSSATSFTFEADPYFTMNSSSSFVGGSSEHPRYVNQLDDSIITTPYLNRKEGGKRGNSADKQDHEAGKGTAPVAGPSAGTSPGASNQSKEDSMAQGSQKNGAEILPTGAKHSHHDHNTRRSSERSPSKCCFCPANCQNSVPKPASTEGLTGPTNLWKLCRSDATSKQCLNGDKKRLCVTSMLAKIKRRAYPEDNYNYRCRYCSDTFRTSSELKWHENKHTNTLQYKCEKCLEAFSDPRTRRQHEVNKHNYLHGRRPRSWDKAMEYATRDTKASTSTMGDLRTSTKSSGGNELEWMHDSELSAETKASSLADEAVEEHSTDAPWVCVFCEKEFTSRRQLQNHQNLHTNTKPFKCQLCPKKFTCPAFRNRHELSVHSYSRKRPIADESSEDYDLSSAGAAMEEYQPAGPEARAMQADSRHSNGTGNSANAKEHASDIATGQEKHISRPLLLQKNYGQRHQYLKQSQVYASHQLKRTGKFSERKIHTQLSFHQNNSNSPFPFQCRICSRGFNAKGNRGVHERRCERKRNESSIRTTDKPSGKNASSPKGVTKAMDIAIKATKWSVADRTCAYCGKVFERVNHCMDHENRHTNTRPYQCRMCTQRFHTRFGRIRHEYKIHAYRQFHSSKYEEGPRAQAKSFRRNVAIAERTCKYCGKIFENISDVERHKKKHSITKPYRCRVCPSRFSFRSNQYRHERTIHKNWKVKSEQEDPNEMAGSSMGNIGIKPEADSVEGTDPYACRYCGKRFSRLCKCQTHERLHTSAAWHLENSRSQNLRQRSSHVATSPKTSNLWPRVQLGRRVDLGQPSGPSETPRTEERKCCKNCSKTFDSTEKLVEHEKSHLGLEMHKCHICTYTVQTYNWNFGLQHHLQEVHGINYEEGQQTPVTNVEEDRVDPPETKKEESKFEEDRAPPPSPKKDRTKIENDRAPLAATKKEYTQSEEAQTEARPNEFKCSFCPFFFPSIRRLMRHVSKTHESVLTRRIKTETSDVKVKPEKFDQNRPSTSVSERTQILKSRDPTEPLTVVDVEEAQSPMIVIQSMETVETASQIVEKEQPPAVPVTLDASTENRESPVVLEASHDHFEQLPPTPEIILKEYDEDGTSVYTIANVPSSEKNPVVSTSQSPLPPNLLLELLAESVETPVSSTPSNSPHSVASTDPAHGALVPFVPNLASLPLQPKSLPSLNLSTANEKMGLFQNFASFPCQMCLMVFKSLQEFQNHTIAMHTQHKTIKCLRCDQRFYTIDELQVHHGQWHYQPEPTPDPPRTEQAPSRTKDPICLRRSEPVETSESWKLPQSSTTASRAVLSSSSGIVPIPGPSTSKQQAFICSACNCLFTDLNLFHEHVNSAHTVQTPIRCQKCGCKFETEGEYSKHVLGPCFDPTTSNKLTASPSPRYFYWCAMCNCGFSRAAIGEAHKRWHASNSK